MPAANMEIILLERVENLGDMGEVVKVRPGYARNFLMPQQKALRATTENVAYFEAQRASLEKLNAEKRKTAEAEAKGFGKLTVTLIRHAADSGQLFGSVNARDIADAITASGKPDIARSQIQLNQSIKTVGLFTVPVALHPEVKIDVTVNVARSEEEAKTQEKTGKAVISADSDAEESAAKKVKRDNDDIDEVTEKAKKELLEESVLKAEEEAKAAGAKEEATEEKATNAPEEQTEEETSE